MRTEKHARKNRIKRDRKAGLPLAAAVLAAVLALAGCAGAGRSPSGTGAPAPAVSESGAAHTPVDTAGPGGTPVGLRGPQILYKPAALREYGWYDWFGQLPERPYTPVSWPSLDALWAEEPQGFQWRYPLNPGEMDFEPLLNSGAMAWLKDFTTDDPEMAKLFSLESAAPVFVLGFGQYGAGLGMDVLPLDTGVYYMGTCEELGNGVFRFAMEASRNAPPEPETPVPMLALELKLEWPEATDPCTLIVTLLAAEGEDAPIYAPYISLPMKFINDAHGVFGGGNDTSDVSNSSGTSDVSGSSGVSSLSGSSGISGVSGSFDPSGVSASITSVIDESALQTA